MVKQEEKEIIREQAIRGRKRWIQLKENYGFTMDKCLVLIPTKNKELKFCAIKFLKEYIEKKYYVDALIIYTQSLDEEEEQYIQDFDKVQLSEVMMDELLRYYRLVQFTKNIIVISENEPYGNLNIVGKKDITLEDYVKDAIYV